MLVNLNEILPAAAVGNYIVPGFNIFGMDEAWQIMKAAEEENSPVILMVNKDMVKAYSIELLGNMLKSVASASRCSVCVHLDHTYQESIIYRAMDSGFSSVMFDGSQLPIEENIVRSKAVADVAHSKNITLEGEIGSVPYPGEKMIKNEKTTPEQALLFATQSGVDAMAVSVGNVHKLKRPDAVIDQDLLKSIEAISTIPLVLHGTSGISDADMEVIVNSRVAKCNIGTVLRQAWGHSLRETFSIQEKEFDRLTLTENALKAIHRVATEKIRALGSRDKN
jgi:fructose-bisphosphate aldolase, class II